jgi:enoyl-CoA hydratase/carnithine racemase
VAVQEHDAEVVMGRTVIEVLRECFAQDGLGLRRLLLDQVRSLARRIATNAPLSVRASKAALRDLARRADVSPIVVALAEQCRTSGDLSEGLAAFSERRTPVFRGE